MTTQDTDVRVADPRVLAALDEAGRRGDNTVQVAAYLDGELIIDVAAGELAPGRPATPRTLYPVFSVTKAITSVALHIQAERGLVRYDDPVATYWPAFGRHGKEAMTVADLLSHRGGIPWMPEGVTLEQQTDWDWMVRQIEETRPAFAPGTTNCYHALIWGWAVGEIVRRTDPGERDFRTFLAEELLTPLGIGDVYFGLPEAEDERLATLTGGSVPDGASDYYLRGMPPAVFPGAEIYNTELSRRSMNPGAGVIARAEGVARFFALLAGMGELNGTRLLSEERVRSFTTPRDGTDEIDEFIGRAWRLSRHGFHLAGPGTLLGDNPNIIHHPGAGGAIGWAELDSGLAVAINHDAMHAGPPPLDEHPFAPVVAAVREVAAELSGASAATR